ERQVWPVRVATWSARHRWPVFVLWFVATLGTFVLSTALGGIRTLDVNSDPNERQLESTQAYAVLGSSAPVAPSERVVIVVDGGPAGMNDPAVQAGVAKLVADLKAATVTINGVATPTFDQLADPLHAPPDAGLVSPDGTAIQIVGVILGERDRVTVLLGPIPAIVDAARAAMP